MKKTVRKVRVISSNVKNLEGIEVDVSGVGEVIEVIGIKFVVDFMLIMGKLVKFGNSNIVCLGEIVDEI